MSRTATYYGLRYGASVYERRRGSPAQIKVGTVARDPITDSIRLTYRNVYSSHNAVAILAEALHKGKVAYVQANLTAYTAQEPAATRGLAEEIDRIIAAHCRPENWK